MLITALALLIFIFGLGCVGVYALQEDDYDHPADYLDGVKKPSKT